jgi:hypothetical protein
MHGVRAGCARVHANRMRGARASGGSVRTAHAHARSSLREQQRILRGSRARSFGLRAILLRAASARLQVAAVADSAPQSGKLLRAVAVLASHRRQRVAGLALLQGAHDSREHLRARQVGRNQIHACMHGAHEGASGAQAQQARRIHGAHRCWSGRSTQRL